MTTIQESHQIWICLIILRIINKLIKHNNRFIELIQARSKLTKAKKKILLKIKTFNKEEGV